MPLICAVSLYSPNRLRFVSVVFVFNNPLKDVAPVSLIPLSIHFCQKNGKK